MIMKQSAWAVLAYGLMCAGGSLPKPSGAAEAGPAGSGGVFSVRDYGALGDGRTLDTEAIQRAIDAASSAGGGTVCLPPGRYLAATIRLKSRVTLRIEAAATLLGSTNLKDFPEIVPRFRSYTDKYVRTSLIYGEDVHDVAIVGRGTIDGQGAAYKDRKYLIRPYLIRFITSQNILMEGLTLKDSPMWLQHYLACDHVTIRGITVHNRVNANNDFVDIDCCRNAIISDCFSDSDDDAVTLKSTADRVCENVTVTNCVLSTRCNGIKCGTESNGGFRNIAISNCTLYKVGLAGIALEMVDGGTLDGITVSNIAMTDVQSPIFLRLGNRARPFKPDMPKPGMGTYKNVLISNVVATGAGKTGCSITGLPDHPVRNVTLSQVAITCAGGGTDQDAAMAVPEKPESYPECKMFGTLPAYGFYCRHVDGLSLAQVRIETTAPDRRPALACDDVQNLAIDALSTSNAEAAAPVIVLNDVRGALIRGCRPLSPTNVFLRLTGKSGSISAIGNDLSPTRTPFELGQGVAPAVLFEDANRKKP
jgi:polygalacturonase